MDNLSDIRNKELTLSERIKAAGKLAVAFSGGVDSTYLLYKAHEVLGDDAIAVTVKSQVITKEEFEWTVEFCSRNGIKQTVLDFDVFAVPEFENNPPPGMRAIAELGITSPLKDSGLTKSDIRALSKEAGLPTWDHPSAACLASRFAYGEKITEEGLVRVARAEKIIKDMGFEGIRVRVHGDLARIEADPADIELIAYGHTRKEISEELKRLGFKYVTIDIDGYRVGSMNEVL